MFQVHLSIKSSRRSCWPWLAGVCWGKREGCLPGVAGGICRHDELFNRPVRARARARVCVCACVRASVCVRVRVCVRARL